MISGSTRALAFTFALAPLACGPAAAPDTPAQQQVDYRAQVAARLEGSTWRLGGWQPEQSLEAMLQSLLAQQLSTMTIRFAQGHVHADSPTIHIDRAYQIVEAGAQFVVVATDETGGTLRTTAQFSNDGQTIYFHGETEPWRGNGTLVRAQ